MVSPTENVHYTAGRCKTEKKNSARASSALFFFSVLRRVREFNLCINVSCNVLKYNIRFHRILFVIIKKWGNFGVTIAFYGYKEKSKL